MLETFSCQIDKICIHIFRLQLAMDKHHLVCDNDGKKMEADPRQGQQDSSKESSHSSLQACYPHCNQHRSPLETKLMNDTFLNHSTIWQLTSTCKLELFNDKFRIIMLVKDMVPLQVSHVYTELLHLENMFSMTSWTKSHLAHACV
jgi:transposase-like protein